jgi:gamma-glutamyl hercynylcysteine S-oxide synthase
MPTSSPSALDDSGDAARRADAPALARALVASRKDTLATFEEVRRQLPDLLVPCDPHLNPPLWELGHVGWFQEYWTSRNPDRSAGPRADPGTPRRPGVRHDADALYDSSRVPHGARWSLPLPTVDETLDDLARQLDATLAALDRVEGDDSSLYFFRLVLFHEDMHHEAAIYMAQALGLSSGGTSARLATKPQDLAREQLAIAGGTRQFGAAGAGFAFDNELPSFAATLPPFTIAAAVVTWAEFLPFVEAGGYQARELWSQAGWRWILDTQARGPRYLVRTGDAWSVERFGKALVLDERLPACHLTFHEAQAWCRWAGRRLPTEFEWEAAAIEAPREFVWGDVWEWTSSPFVPYAGFEPHPYRDYSAPWFDGRPVLRGASFATQARMRHVRYRNFFTAERSDIFAGFRSCALE